MLEAFDPAAQSPAKPFAATLLLTDAAEVHLDGAANIRAYLDRLLAGGLLGDALVVIANALPVQLSVPWCCECVRVGIEGAGPAVEAERAGVTLAEQCLRDPTDANRELCLEFAARAKRKTAGAWLATAAAWADGHAVACTSRPRCRRRPRRWRRRSSRRCSAGRGAPRRRRGDPRSWAYATRALALFGPRPGKN